MEPLMDFAFEPTVIALQDQVREFVREEVIPNEAVY